MLAGLGHGAVIRRDYQQHEINAGSSCDHGMHQPLVAGHVHEAENVPRFQRLIGIAEIKGDAARFLLR